MLTQREMQRDYGKMDKKKCNNLPATVFTGIGVIDKFFNINFFYKFLVFN